MYFIENNFDLSNISALQKRGAILTPLLFHPSFCLYMAIEAHLPLLGQKKSALNSFFLDSDFFQAYFYHLL